MSKICGLKVGNAIYDLSNEEQMSALSENQLYVISYLMNHITESGDPNAPDIPRYLYAEADFCGEGDNAQIRRDFCAELQKKGIGDGIYWPVEQVAPVPHELTKAEFIAVAQVEALVNHGRKWKVTLGSYSSFSDAETQEAAMADVHHGAVNNALYFNSPDAVNLHHKESMPPIRVLVDYLDLVEQYNVTGAIAA